MRPSSYLLLAVLAASLGSCSPQLVRVKPYERGNLAKPIMTNSRAPLLEAMAEHAYFTREASFGGGGVGGGGCGCN